jgi:PAS domain S-box-containing protein
MTTRSIRTKNDCRLGDIAHIHFPGDRSAFRKTKKRYQSPVDVSPDAVAFARITHLINSISSILIAVTEDWRIEFWNTEAEKQFGITEKEVLGRPLQDLKINWELKRITDGIRKCFKGGSTVYLDDVKFTQTNGKEGLLGIQLDAISRKESKETAILIQGANITKRKILESQLSQAQKLESIGQLAAGIAHEINTPTQYVGDNIRFLKDSFRDIDAILKAHKRLLDDLKVKGESSIIADEIEVLEEQKDLKFLLEDIPKAIDQSLEGIERVSTIVKSIKEFSHPDQHEKTWVDINKALESTITVSRNEWKYVAEVTTRFEPDLPLLHCYPGELNQAFLNMMVNAAHAIEAVGGRGGDGKGKIEVISQKKGKNIVVRFKDSGTGMKPEIISKIFDPFFTTKEVGKGTGQGLAISHTVVVEKHGGSIRVNSKPGEGTEFIVSLPLEPAEN